MSLEREYMLNITCDESRLIAILEPDGSLTPEDFIQVCRVINKHLNFKNSMIGIIVQTQDFTNWDSFSDLLPHLTFVHDYHTRVKNIALVSDSNVVGFSDRMIRHFVNAEVCAFSFDNYEHARKWMLNNNNV